MLAQAIARAFDLDDDGVVQEAVQEGCRDDGIAEHRRVPLFRIGQSLELPSLIPSIRYTASGLI